MEKQDDLYAKVEKEIPKFIKAGCFYPKDSGLSSYLYFNLDESLKEEFFDGVLEYFAKKEEIGLDYAWNDFDYVTLLADEIKVKRDIKEDKLRMAELGDELRGLEEEKRIQEGLASKSYSMIEPQRLSKLNDYETEALRLKAKREKLDHFISKNLNLDSMVESSKPRPVPYREIGTSYILSNLEAVEFISSYSLKHGLEAMTLATKLVFVLFGILLGAIVYMFLSFDGMIATVCSLLSSLAFGLLVVFLDDPLLDAKTLKKYENVEWLTGLREYYLQKTLPREKEIMEVLESKETSLEDAEEANKKIQDIQDKIKDLQKRYERYGNSFAHNTEKLGKLQLCREMILSQAEGDMLASFVQNDERQNMTKGKVKKKVLGG